MGDTVENIEYNIVTKGVNETVYDFSRVRDAAQKISVDAEAAGSKSSGSFKGLGLVAKSLGHEFGITGDMSRLLSREVVGMAATLGKGALAFGVVGIAAMGAKMVYDHFSEAAKKKREELEKNISSLTGEVSALYSNQNATDRLKKANYDLLMVKREILKFDLKKMLEEDTKAIDEQSKTLADGESSWSSLLNNIWNQDTSYEGAYNRAKDFITKEKNELDRRVANRRLHQTQLDEISRKPDSFFAYAELEALKKLNQEQIKHVDYEGQLYARLSEKEASFAQNSVSLMQARGDSVAAIYEAELYAFDATTDAKLKNAKTLDEADQIYTERKMQRTTLTYQHEKKIDELMIKNKQTLANEISQVFDDLYELSDKKQKAWFYAARGAAAAEAFFSYQLAAANSVGKMGPFGIGMAAYFEALSYIKPALILATSLTGPSGGGGTSTPPSSPDSSHDWDTGGSGGNNSTINLHLNINGKSVTMNDIGSLTSDVVKYLYDNNGSVDGLTISVDRSA